VRLLLDNCVPVRLARQITGHIVESAVRRGWAALDDGPLLDAMTGQFEVLITVDKSMRFQQRLAGRPISIVVLRAKSNHISDLAPLVPALVIALADVKPGEVREIS
jgi:predicted nuclease of predicted toxin-antitoxin system